MKLTEMVREALTARADAWVNLITGVGARDRSKALTFQAGARMPDVALEAIYVGDPYAGRICRAVPEEALRQGIKVKCGDAATEAKMQARLDELGAVGALSLGWTWGRVFGGGALFVGADDGQDPREPLDLTKIDRVRFLVTLDKTEMQPQRWYNDPLKSTFGTPETYLLTRNSNGGAADNSVVHASRLILFDGAPTTRRRRQELNGWGESEIQRVYDILQKFNGGWEATGHLLQESSQATFKMKGLWSMMAQKNRDLLMTRLEMMDLSRSVARAVLLDADGNESFDRTEVGALTGLAAVLDKFLLLLSGAAEIPVTILMGQSPAGLSATGESDVRWFYDRVKAAQTTYLRPRVERLVRLLFLSKAGPTGGQEPASWSVEFPPLWQPSPTEEADLRVKQAGVDVQYITAQVLTPEEVAVNRFRSEGWSAETSIDIEARKALIASDAAGQGDDGSDEGDDAPGAEHADGIAAVIARVAAREIPRDAGVELLVQSFGLDPAAADRAMGETGRTFFTAPEPGHAAEMDSMRGELSKAQASLRGHQQYTARLIEEAKAGGLKLGAFTSREPTEVAEGDTLEPGDVVAVPVENGG